ncbi:hypothetical protein SAMN05216430_10546 [Limosilactobacillus mucosae]|nr:hypothetical protein SAMN05216430_10546 [Limosilactobacillus mucosae]SEK80811.1 hypothetical protein SAMN05216545_10546 [Limosilactobacillus mucosae]SFK12777.1 hypothetical protein SAMN05216461_105105 [Limosilactobacillus mucosae]
MFLIILIIVLGICWYLHSKKGIKRSHMLGAIGLGIVSIIYWAFKVDADLDKKVSNNFEKTHNATKEDLVYWATQSNDLIRERTEKTLWGELAPNSLNTINIINISTFLIILIYIYKNRPEEIFSSLFLLLSDCLVILLPIFLD